MMRRSKDEPADNNIIFFEENEQKNISPVNPPEKISLNQYLSIYNRQKVLDRVIRTWFSKFDNTKPKKTKEEWDQIINKFHAETE